MRTIEDYNYCIRIYSYLADEAEELALTFDKLNTGLSEDEIQAILDADGEPFTPHPFSESLYDSAEWLRGRIKNCKKHRYHSWGV